jgi:hypothetical protein
LLLKSESISQDRRDKLAKWASTEEGQDFIALLKQAMEAELIHAGNASISLLEDAPGAEEVGQMRGFAMNAAGWGQMAHLLTAVAAGQDVLFTHKILQ